MYEQTKKELDSLVTKGIVPGISYAFITHDQVEKKIFGQKQLVPVKKPLVGGELYDLASLTKVIGTTTVILKLAEQGKLAIDDPVQKYLIRFTDQRVTLRHLLTHTSALSGYIKDRDHLPPKELLTALYTLRPKTWLGKKVVYADIGLILLGEVIEVFYGRPVQEVIASEVLAPLQMKESTFTPEKDRCVPTEITAERGLIQGEVHDPKAYILGKHCGSAGLFAPLDDLIIFAQWLLGKRRPLRPIVTDKTLTMLFRDHTPTRKLGRSLGWDLRYDPKGQACLYHTGFTGTFIVIDRKNQTALIVLSNRIHPSADNEPFLKWRDVIVSDYLREKES